MDPIYSRKIAILDPHLANQIAAGEVVERPASVVKELLENSLDAGSTSVIIDITGGGMESICVSDDGVGMDAEDALLCLKRHATSKLRTEADLWQIATLGFRGEALPSIASVSRFALSTRTRNQNEATCIQMDGNSEPKMTSAGAAYGTRVEVRDLFFNVPARRKFLKSTATENAHIAEICLRAALSKPALRLVYNKDGRRHKEYLPAHDVETRVRTIFPSETLVRVEGERGRLRLTAFLGRPERTRNHANALHLFINGRAVRDRSVARAITFGYGSVMPPGAYPQGVIFLEVDPQDVDVNVHPQKLEVRFAQAHLIYEAITRITAAELGRQNWNQRALAHVSALPNVSTMDARAGVESRREDGSSAQAPVIPYATPSRSLSETSVLRLQEPTADQGFWSQLRVLSQSRRLFLVCEGTDALYIIDQHAADERVRFHQLSQAYRSGQVPMQRLLLPERLTVTETEAARVDEQHDALLNFGIDCNLLSADTIAIHAVPALLQRAKPQKLVQSLLAELQKTGARGFSGLVDLGLATLACHGALRAGDLLSVEEGQALLRLLDEVDFSGHCPHGRPIVYSITFSDLERHVGR